MSTSLRTLLPIGLYDAAKLRPPLLLRREADCEAYDGIGKEQLNLDDLPVLADAEGPFGSPTSDSRRTMVTEVTSASPAARSWNRRWRCSPTFSAGTARAR